MAKSNYLDEIMNIDKDNLALLQLGWKPEFDLVNGMHTVVVHIRDS